MTESLQELLDRINTVLDKEKPVQIPEDFPSFEELFQPFKDADIKISN